MSVPAKRITRTPYHDGNFSDEELEYMGRTGQIPLSLVPTNECPKCGGSICHCEAEREEYEREMAENAPDGWLDDNPPPTTDRDAPPLTEAEEEERRAEWWHEQMMTEEWDEMEEMAA